MKTYPELENLTPKKVFILENKDEFDNQFGSLVEFGLVTIQDYFSLKARHREISGG